MTCSIECKSPFYHLTVTDSRHPRDGSFIERVGFFNMDSRRPKVVDVAAREARQPLEADFAEHHVLPAQQFAGGYPRHLAKRLADLRQQPDVRRRLAVLERSPAVAAAPVLNPADLPPLPDQAVDLDLGEARHLDQEASHDSLVALAERSVAKPAEQFANDGIGAPLVLVFVVHCPAACDEGSNLLNGV